MKKRYYLFFFCLLLSACKKGFLDTVPDSSLLIPATVNDMQALLDNFSVFNTTPGISANADGDLYTTDAGFDTWGTDSERNSYTWSADIWGTFDPPDWTVPYQQVFYANVVLDGLKRLPATENGASAVKGGALFSRAFAYYNLMQAFGTPELGLPIRLSADVTQRPQRSSAAATYARIIADLNAARPLLPKTAAYKSRPTQAAAYALLARTCLVTGDYSAAGKYADSSLRQYDKLIDYNTLDPTASRPFPRAVPNGNDEIIYYASEVSWSFLSKTTTRVDSDLYRSYGLNDLRRTIFFKPAGNGVAFKGNYAGIIVFFSGLATDEMYLVRAECAARQGRAEAALDDLNTVLAQRWVSGTFVPFTAADAASALQLILTERRKELLCRNIRWSDLKRLQAGQTLTHTVAGNTYTLPPGSKRYAYPLPLDEIRLSGAQQNPR